MALLQVDFFSEVLGMCTQMSVILPQRTSRQIGMTGTVREGKYPAVFLLHGMTDDHTTWCRRTSIERYVSELGIAVIMPEVQLGWYTDTKYGMRYQTFLCRELPGICREFFPNISDRKEDILAAGVLRALYERNIKVPEDISVIGYDDTIAKFLSPPLSTMRLPVREIAEAAVVALITKLEKPGGNSGNRTVKIGPVYVERNSVRDLNRQ